MRPSLKSALLLVGIAGMFVASCSSQPEIYRARASGDGITFLFEMGACNGDYAVTISEDVEEVRVDIKDQRRRTPLGGDDCGDVVGPITLEEPLGDRRLVDIANDVEIPVLFTPWNQAAHSDAEYLAAVEAAAECIEGINPEAIVNIVIHPDGYPDLRVDLPELSDGERTQTNPESVCVKEHIDPLRK